MKCKDFEKNLSSYIENEICNEIKIDFEKHLKDCYKCQELLNLFIEVKNVLSKFPKLEVREGLVQNILKKTISHKKAFFIPFLEPVLISLIIFIFVFSPLLIPQSRKFYIGAEKQLHLIYSEIKKIQVRGESLKGILRGYKENLLDSFKEKKLFLFKSEFSPEDLIKEEKNGRKENKSAFSS
jgi:hypothetical protein